MTTSLRVRGLLAASVSAAALMAFSTSVMAQAPAPAPADQGNVIQEVIVTAQKKEEAIQTVPIAVSAFSEKTLELQKIDGGPDLLKAIPNVSFSKDNFTGYNFQIRGIGSKLIAGDAESGVGIHLNNAPLTANNLFEAEFFDVERVEVLRGPQGTLYGRNATGGVVNVITAKPTDQFSGMLNGEYGNYNSEKVKGFINVPIMGDKLEARVAGSYLKRDGYGVNLTNGHNIDGRDLYSVRATVAFNPTERFHTYLMWEHFNENDDRSRTSKQLCHKDLGPTSVGGVPVLDPLLQGFLSQGCSPGSLYDEGAYGATNSRATLGGLLGNLTGLIPGDAYAGKVQDHNLRNIESAFDPVYRSKSDVVEFNATWDLTDTLKFTSLTSYSKENLYSFADYNRIAPTNNLVTPSFDIPEVGSVPATVLFPDFFKADGVFVDPQVGASNQFRTFDISSGNSKQVSQEFRLQSSFNGPINFNVGAIYIDFKSMTDYYVLSNTLTADAVLNNQGPCAVDNPACIYVDPGFPPSGIGHNYYDNRTPYHLKSKALFGELYWQATDTLKFTAGIRYTDDRKLVTNLPVVLLVPGSGHPGANLQIAEFKEPTGRIGFDWKPSLSFTNQTLVYAFYSRGYKAGGVNPPQSVGLASVKATYDPEFINAYEVGTKNTLLDGSLIMNLTGFYYQYSGYQVSKIVQRTSVNENIDANVWGLEAESIWEPVRNLRFNMNLGYLDTKITGGESIDTLDRTQGDPSLTLVKASDVSNCVAPTAGVATVLAIIEGLPGAPNVTGVTGNPTALLGICSGLFAAAPIGAIPSDGVPVQLKDKQLPNSPHFTLSIGGQYTMELGPDWSATARADYYMQTKTFSRIYNSVSDQLKSWDSANFSLGFDNAPWGLHVEGFVKNAFNSKAITDSYLTDDSSGLFTNIFIIEPRLYGVSVTKKF